MWTLLSSALVLGEAVTPVKLISVLAVMAGEGQRHRETVASVGVGTGQGQNLSTSVYRRHSSRTQPAGPCGPSQSEAAASGAAGVCCGIPQQDSRMNKPEAALLRAWWKTLPPPSSCHSTVSSRQQSAD
jgi:hypothetical protein